MAMNKYAYLLLSLVLFSSCEKFDDPIPEGSSLEVPTLYTEIVSPTEVLLTWSSVQICAGFCPSTVMASYYEVWAKSLTSGISYKLAEVPAGQLDYAVSGLESGVAQEFYVIAKRANVRHETNRVMVVPNALPTPEVVFQKEGHSYITHPQLSPDGTQVAYSTFQSSASGTFQDILIYNLGSKTERLVLENGQFPSWSASGDKLAYVSEESDGTQVQVVDLGTGEVVPVIGSAYSSYFPVFVDDDESLVFFLDSLGEGDTGLIAVGMADPDTTFLHEVQRVDSHFSPIQGMSYESESGRIAFGIPASKAIETDYASDVVGFAISSPSSSLEFVVSDWEDASPSFSRENPDLLAFISDRSGVFQVWVKNLDSGTLIQVTDFRDSQWINSGIVGLSWSGELLYVNVQEVPGTTKLLRLDLAALLSD